MPFRSKGESSMRNESDAMEPEVIGGSGEKLGSMAHRLPPGPPGRLVPTYKLIFDPVRSMQQWQAQYGTTFTIKRLDQTVVVTSEPELIQQLYAVKDASLFAASVPQTAEVLVGKESLLLLAGEEHQRMRRLMTPSFHGAKVMRWTQAIADAAEAGFDVDDEMPVLRCAQETTLEVIVRVVLGVDDASERRKFMNATQDWVRALRPSFIFTRFLQREFLGLSSFARYRRLSERVDRMLLDQIARARARKEDGTDILSEFLKARYEDGTSLGDASILSQLRTLVFAGHDTTASAIAWSLYYLMKNDSVRERALAELEALGPEPSPDELVRLPYLGAVVDETLRIRPVTVDIVRLLRRSWQFGEWVLPPGTAISAVAPLTHLRDDLWPNPEEFRPERFLGKHVDPSTYLPFGGGVYRCIGSQFARVELLVVLGTVLRKFHFQLLDEQVEWGRELALLQPRGGIRMRISRR